MLNEEAKWRGAFIALPSRPGNTHSGMKPEVRLFVINHTGTWVNGTWGNLDLDILSVYNIPWTGHGDKERTSIEERVVQETWQDATRDIHSNQAYLNEIDSKMVRSGKHGGLVYVEKGSKQNHLLQEGFRVYNAFGVLELLELQEKIRKDRKIPREYFSREMQKILDLADRSEIGKTYEHPILNSWGLIGPYCFTSGKTLDKALGGFLEVYENLGIIKNLLDLGEPEGCGRG